MLQKSLKMEIEQALGQEISTISTLSAANNAYIYKLVLSDGSDMVAKVADAGLDVEAFMLNYLKENSKLPTPEIHYTQPHVLIMDFILADWETGVSMQKDTAELLANLHSVKADRFGFEKDTSIGSLHQPNERTDDWAKFFIEKRLLYMAQEALSEDVITAGLMKKIERLAQKTPEMIKTDVEPSLVHGDVWSGNILSARGKVNAFIDPAIYYADPEVELAFMILNSFDRIFFQTYHDISPIRDGFFEERCHIYNIYPLLARARLFGTSYARKVEKTVDKVL